MLLLMTVFKVIVVFVCTLWLIGLLVVTVKIHIELWKTHKNIKPQCQCKAHRGRENG